MKKKILIMILVLTLTIGAFSTVFAYRQCCENQETASESTRMAKIVGGSVVYVDAVRIYCVNCNSQLKVYES